MAGCEPSSTPQSAGNDQEEMFDNAFNDVTEYRKVAEQGDAQAQEWLTAHGK